MELSGKIIIDIPMQTGTSKAGNPWKKKEWVLETFGSYPKKVKFHIFGDRADTIHFEVGKNYTVSFDLESREFNGRWYTDVSVFAARDYADTNMTGGYPPAPEGMQYGAASQPAYQQPMAPMAAPASAPAQPFGAAPQPTFTPSSNGAEEDLPF